MARVTRSELASSRYRHLIEELAEERAHRYGWKSEVARMLGVTPGYVNQITAGKKVSIGADAIGRAMDALDLDESYFYAAELGEKPIYTAHVRGREKGRASMSMSATTLAHWERVHAAARKVDAAMRARLPDADVIALMRELVGALEENPLFGWYRTAAELIDAAEGERGERPKYHYATVAMALAGYADATSIGLGVGRS